MNTEKTPINQEEKSFKENLELLNRINKLKNKALELMKNEGVDKEWKY